MANTAPRTFTFTTIFASEIPAEALKSNIERDTANDLPFKAWFDGNAKPVLEESKLATIFVPFSYFSTPTDKGGRGIDPAKVDAAYVKGKLRDQFNSWQGKTETVVQAPVFEKKEITGKDGAKRIVNGKVVTPKIAYNTERGAFSIAMLERTGKEKNLVGQKELGMTEPGVQLWMQATKEGRAKAAAAEATAKANLAAKEASQTS